MSFPDILKRDCRCKCGECPTYRSNAPNAVWAPDCPRRSKIEWQMRRERIARHRAGVRPTGSRCPRCSGLPHRRQRPVCPGCGAPWGPDAIDPRG